MNMVYVPDEVLPIFPTYSTVVKDGVKYKAYFETDWHQVMTEDGVPLCQLLESMPSIGDNGYFRYCGILKNRPDMTAMEQLYALRDQTTGDIYLIETDIVSENGRVCELYVWLGNATGWVFCGTTDKKASVELSLPETMQLFPRELGKPNQVLIVSEDGKTLVWGASEATKEIEAHNSDTSAHQDIRDAIDLKADRLVIFNDELLTSEWVYNSEFPCFEYVYTNEKFPKGSYFEIVPIVNSTTDSDRISESGLSGVFEIFTDPSHAPYAIFRSSKVPSENISICIKLFGTFKTEL